MLGEKSAGENIFKLKPKNRIYTQQNTAQYYKRDFNKIDLLSMSHIWQISTV